MKFLSGLILAVFVYSIASQESCVDIYNDVSTETGTYNVTLYGSTVAEQNYSCWVERANVSSVNGAYIGYWFSITEQQCIDKCADFGPLCSSFTYYHGYALCYNFNQSLIDPPFYYYDSGSGLITGGLLQCEVVVEVFCNFTLFNTAVTTVPHAFVYFYAFQYADWIEYTFNYGTFSRESLRKLNADSAECTQEITIFCTSTDLRTWGIKLLADPHTEIPFEDSNYESCDCILDACCSVHFLQTCKCQGSSDTTYDQGLIKNAPVNSVIARGVGAQTMVIIDSVVCSRPIADIDDCASNPCINGATCEDTGLVYECHCQPGYTGVNCETDINECSSSEPLCLNGANCNNFPGSYSCVCATGFTGDNCGSDMDECESDPCKNKASCVDGISRFECICARGFGGTFCDEDFNECSSSPCLSGGTCLNEAGKFTCVCMPGFCGIACENDIDECASNPCVHATSCTDMENKFECVCAEGYNGTLCEIETDECSSNPCENQATCHDELSAFLCECATGFTGTLCETDVDDCANDPCMHGTCHDGVDQFSCTCEPGYEGDICQTDVDECESTPCQNLGVCTDGADTFTCECRTGFSGKLCETNLDECESSPCQNSGQCKDGDDRYYCLCNSGNTGTNCEQFVIDGMWSNWGEWGECSTVCNYGAETRQRQCSSPPPQNGGKYCPGDLIEYTVCNEDESQWQCDNVDGRWGPWGEWNPCSASCGDGTKSRERFCDSPSPQGDGVECVGEGTMSLGCVSDCESSMNGNWGSWGEWSACSKTCGVAEQRGARQCDSPAPSLGGEDCPGSAKRIRPCKLEDCPVWDKFDAWGEWSECTATCGSGTKSRKRLQHEASPGTGEKYKYDHKSCSIMKRCGPMKCQVCSQVLEADSDRATCRGALLDCKSDQDFCAYDIHVLPSGDAVLNKSCATQSECYVGKDYACTMLHDQTVDSVETDSPNAELYLELNKDTVIGMLGEHTDLGDCMMCCDTTECNKGIAPYADTVVGKSTASAALQHSLALIGMALLLAWRS